jgi:DhnA family fructose-bisphosphate aldolase class Ia
MSKSTSGLLNSKTGNAVCVAFDHGIGGGGGFPEARNPRATVEKFIVAQPDGVLMSPPLIHICADLYQKYPTVTPIATLVTRGRTPNFSGPVQVYDFDFAIRMGARAIKNLLILGQSDSRDLLENMKNTAYLANQARKEGIPFMVEAVLWGPEIPLEKQNDPDLIYSACRMAFECGADIIKTNYTGDTSSFRDITSSLPVPIFILGGAKAKMGDVLQSVRDAMDAGGRGVAFGRNVFQHEHPASVVEALKGLVHDSVTVREALKKVK